MSYLLRIDSSASGDASFSRRVADSFTDTWNGDVVRRDLVLDPIGHLDAAGITARTTPADQHTPEQRAAAALQDELVEEFLGDPNLMALDVRTITPELTYALTMEPLRPLHQASLADAHAQARRQAECIARSGPPALAG